jgi:hypothetical protein
MSARRPRPPKSYPLVLRWDEYANPLPVRRIEAPARRNAHPVEDAPPWFPTGVLHMPFDFCGHVRRLLVDIVERCADLRHVDVARLLLAVTQARNGHAHGLQARVTPLRFARGKLINARQGVPYQVQRYFLGNHEYLYLMSFCLPRFLNLPANQPRSQLACLPAAELRPVAETPRQRARRHRASSQAGACGSYHVVSRELHWKQATGAVIVLEAPLTRVLRQCQRNNSSMLIAAN